MGFKAEINRAAMFLAAHVPDGKWGLAGGMAVLGVEPYLPELCRLTHGCETGDVMEKRQMNLRYLVLALATLTSISLAGSSFALPISIFPAEEITNSTLLKPIHGCHPYYEWGWVRRWDTEARHRHSQRYDCEPRGGGGGGDWDRRGEGRDGPPRGESLCIR